MKLSKYEIYRLTLAEYRQTYPHVSEGLAAMSILMTFDYDAYKTYRGYAYDPSIYDNVMPEFLQALEDYWWGE